MIAAKSVSLFTSDSIYQGQRKQKNNGSSAKLLDFIEPEITIGQTGVCCKYIDATTLPCSRPHTNPSIDCIRVVYRKETMETFDRFYVPFLIDLIGRGYILCILLS